MIDARREINNPLGHDSQEVFWHLQPNCDGIECIRKEYEYNVQRFLNRVLALEVEQQNALFDYFADLFDQTVRYAKANGTFDEGVTDIATRMLITIR
jgi:C-terminal domain on Strawberry notch homologue